MKRVKRIDRVLLLVYADLMAGRIDEFGLACDKAEIAGRLPPEISRTRLSFARSIVSRYRCAVRGEIND